MPQKQIYDCSVAFTVRNPYWGHSVRPGLVNVRLSLDNQLLEDVFVAALRCNVDGSTPIIGKREIWICFVREQCPDHR